jgi:hypothetical protein
LRKKELAFKTRAFWGESDKSCFPPELTLIWSPIVVLWNYMLAEKNIGSIVLETKELAFENR